MTRPLYALLAVFLALGCAGDQGPGCQDMFGCETYDVTTRGIPQFVAVNYIDLTHIARVSRFRSAVGHDYSDDFESCRSMKHYFDPSRGNDPTGTKIFAPVSGHVIFLENEAVGGTHIQLRASNYPAFFFDLFHVSLSSALSVGTQVTAGQLLGTHANAGTFSDIAVAVHTPTDGPNDIWPPGWQLISYFDVVTDSIIALYQGRGLTSRDTMVIARTTRDSAPVPCSGFSTTGQAGDWYDLTP
jgi:hypothetical protein